eukprot:6922217-Pyramimonas_sp.AAC.1
MLAALSPYLGYASQIIVSYLSRCPSAPPCPACPSCPATHARPACAACPACPGAPAPAQAERPVSEAPRAAESALVPISLRWVALAVVRSFVLGSLSSCAARSLVQI